MAGGDLTTLAMTVPGVRVSVKGGSGQGNMNANGVPGAAILYTLNGADVMDPYLNLNNSGASNNLLGANEIAEAAVILNAFSAQYGRMAGGQENLIGKSGANAFHGNLVYNYNDAIFNANDWFRNQSGLPRDRAVANEYGGSVSGPVIKNKVFFFFDAEGLRYALPASSNVVLPSKPFQQYILSQINANALPYYQAAFTLMNNAPGYNLAQPVTTGTLPTQDSSGNLGCQTKGTFKTKNVTAPGGGIFGQTVSCAVAFLSANNQLNTEDLMIARGDYNINEKHKMNFRYQYDTVFSRLDQRHQPGVQCHQHPAAARRPDELHLDHFAEHRQQLHRPVELVQRNLRRRRLRESPESDAGTLHHLRRRR